MRNEKRKKERKQELKERGEGAVIKQIICLSLLLKEIGNVY